LVTCCELDVNRYDLIWHLIFFINR
jgi:hypothetical protein